MKNLRSEFIKGAGMKIPFQYIDKHTGLRQAMIIANTRKAYYKAVEQALRK
jgi:hypothetical protein